MEGRSGTEIGGFHVVGDEKDQQGTRERDSYQGDEYGFKLKAI